MNDNDMTNEENGVETEEKATEEDVNAEEMKAIIADPFETDRVIEAVLFASSEPLSVKDIAQKINGWAEGQIAESLERLKERYEGRGFVLVRREDVWAFRTAGDIASYMASYREVEKKLSRAAMETLAIIAYHQPVTRAEIENIRGVAVGKGTLDLLIEAGWVGPGRRREVPGRPLTWKTTSKFLDYFNLESLSDLPGIEDLKAAGLLDKRPAIETLPTTEEMFDEEDETQEPSALQEDESRDSDEGDELNEEDKERIA